MSKKRIFILGAGLAGLSAAWHLQKKGLDCHIFEKESDAGGLCRSKNINGFTFDIDGHLLHFKHSYAFNLAKNLLGNDLIEHKRSAWIYSYGRFSRYPFQANLYGLPKSVIQDCLLEFIKVYNNGHKKVNDNCSFYDWINHTFGKGIARHFMVPYNTKFWTIPPGELTCEWLHGFIPVPSLSQILEGTIDESRRQFGYNAHFWYPKKGGIASFTLALAKQIKNIHTGCQITEIDLAKKEISMSSGRKEKFDYLVSTVPLPDMARLIKGLRKQKYALFKKLRWNSIFNLNLGLDQKDYDGRHWVYFPQNETCFFRVGFFNNLSSCLAPPNRSSLYSEVAYSNGQPIDKDNIVSRIKEDLRKVGIISPKDRIYAQDINDIKYGYPIYDKNYQKTRAEILQTLSVNNIIACGRYGSWRYMSMEDVILDGKDAAGRILDAV